MRYSGLEKTGFKEMIQLRIIPMGLLPVKIKVCDCYQPFHDELFICENCIAGIESESAD